MNARDRIGKGPWRNSKGAVIANTVDELHSAKANLSKQTLLTEKGQPVNGRGDNPNQHDMLTGSQMNGNGYTDTMDHTCNNWTSSATGSAQVGPPIAWVWMTRRRRGHGTARTRARAAVSRIWSAQAAPDCSTVSRRTSDP